MPQDQRENCNCCRMCNVHCCDTSASSMAGGKSMRCIQRISLTAHSVLIHSIFSAMYDLWYKSKVQAFQCNCRFISVCRSVSSPSIYRHCVWFRVYCARILLFVSLNHSLNVWMFVCLFVRHYFTYARANKRWNIEWRRCAAQRQTTTTTTTVYLTRIRNECRRADSFSGNEQDQRNNNKLQTTQNYVLYLYNIYIYSYFVVTYTETKAVISFKFFFHSVILRALLGTVHDDDNDESVFYK